MKKTLLATLLASLFALTSPTLHAKTYDEASIKELKALESAGDVTAMAVLGNRYDSGEGVKEDDAEGVKWYRKAAEQGVAEAQFNLGLKYAKGEGVKQDDAEAVKWYRKAAEQGFADAQYNLGVRYVKGEGLKEDLAEGLKWVKKAAKQGNEIAKETVPKIERLIAMEKGTATETPKSDTGSSKSAKGSDQYTDNGDGTVTDTKTKLMWKQCSEGQSGKDCSGEAAKYKWDDAMSKFGKGVSFAGHSDWRMPTKEELHTLVYCSNGTPQEEAWDDGCNGKDDKADEYKSPTINQNIFPHTANSFYWSSTEKNTSDAWNFNFIDGYDFDTDHSFSFHVRLVRSSQ